MHTILSETKSRSAKNLFLHTLFFILLVTQINNAQWHSQNQFETPVFETISIEDGLPENSVTCILQDYLGYMWFGTKNGLVKYDSYTMTVYKPDKINDKSISGRVIIDLFEDNNKTLWVGTLDGLNRFNRGDESFTSYRFNPNDTNSISSDSVHTIYEDRFGRLWIGTLSGLNLFNKESGKFTRFYFVDSKSKAVSHIQTNQYSLSINTITDDPLSEDVLLGTGFEGLWRFNINEKQISRFDFNDSASVNKKLGKIQNIYKSRDSKLWMVTINSVSCLDPVSKECKCYFDFPIREWEQYAEPYYLSGSIIEDQFGNIAAGFFAEEKGLIYLNPNTGEINNFELIPNRSRNTWLNKIHSLYEDRSGIIWIGTWSTGVKKWKRYENKFSVLQSNASDPNSLSSPEVYSLICDPKGYTWYCTPEGLDRYDQRTRRYTHYLRDEKCVTDFMVFAAMIDHSGILWLGTSNCGLVKFDSQYSTYRFCLNNPNKLNLMGKTILCLLQDHLGYIWIGTLGFGIYKYDPVNGNLEQYKNDPADSLSLSENEVVSILEDHNDNLWVGTNAGGLNKFNRETGRFTYAGFKNCLSLYEDSENRFWVAEYLSGLNLFDTEKLKVTANFSRDNGLASNSNIGVIEDDYKNLWFVSDAGISRVNPETKKVKNFMVENKFSDVFNFYIPSCTGKGIDGKMYINTRKGVVIFNPANVNDDPTPPQVVISDLSLFNRPEKKLDYTGFIPEAKEITLPYDLNDLRFDYVGLQYNEPLKNTYKYILENFDDDWVEAGTQRNATYTNLNPGEYVFRVTASNRDGVWNETGASIKIVILPPWWKTWWAYLLYTLTILSIFIASTRFYLNRQRLRQKLVLESEHAEKLEEVAQMKSDFFTNISHEFRTPLTLILGPVKQVIEKIKDTKIKEELSIVHKNANNLLGLVNQLLDISKLESGNMKLKTFPMNVIPFLKALVHSFASYAERKNIALRFISQENEIIAYIDKDKIEKIIINILSNAFKFTPEGGQIDINVSKLNKHVDVSISDTGIGISKEKIPFVFDRFYQVDGNHKSEYEGTGIGLALTKELVELHHGKIAIDSVEGKGTTFIVSIPLGNEHLTPEEICDAPEAETIVADSKAETIFIGESKEELFADKKSYSDLDIGKEETILIVEDNTDVRNYIKNNLENDYRVLEAIDGEDGWNNSVESLPDIIVSDVMMPKMDGFTLLEKLKTDERTSHIPVILLTARAASEDKIEGYKTGADAYIMKPFDTNELKARIKNLLEQRKRIHQHFQRKGIFDLDKPGVNSVDKIFLRKAFDTITQNISDPSFSVESFAENMAISRYVLYKKIVSLTGESPVELIRRIRLQRAAELIEKNFGNLSEIALEVGFSNPAYFSDCFKKQFGVSPSHYPQKTAGN
jgi:signal transduction histidine kinase/ligand-binding sensor domain-containing protein/DNA-binding response OmpR family regulator